MSQKKSNQLSRRGLLAGAVAEIDAGTPNVDDLATDFVSAVTTGTGVEPVFNTRRTIPWLHATTWPGLGEPGNVLNRRYKINKSRRAGVRATCSTTRW